MTDAPPEGLERLIWNFEQVKLQAQAHAQEARTANATIAEIYQLCTGKTGEPGNWNGAEIVRQLVAQRDALKQSLEKLNALLDFGSTWDCENCFEDASEINAACQEAFELLAALDVKTAEQTFLDDVMAHRSVMGRDGE